MSRQGVVSPKPPFSLVRGEWWQANEDTANVDMGEVFHERSVASLAPAAIECGHQHTDSPYWRVQFVFMSPDGERILDHLRTVSAERARRGSDVFSAARVQALKAFQHLRFAATYSDLLADARYGPAARFFLEDLYGPRDFTERDDQFARVVPGLTTLFPSAIVKTVAALAELHALSESLDGAMALRLSDEPLDGASYGRAWRAVGRPYERERQIVLMVEVGTALDQFTRKPLLRHSLRLMRGPATAAGLGALQRFLETGFDTFREMRGAQGMLDTIARRERGLAARLFAGGDLE